MASHSSPFLPPQSHTFSHFKTSFTATIPSFNRGQNDFRHDALPTPSYFSFLPKSAIRKIPSLKPTNSNIAPDKKSMVLEKRKATLFFLSFWEVPRILLDFCTSRSEVAKSFLNVLVKPPNFEHRRQTGLLHDRSAAIAQKKYYPGTPPNATLPQRNKAWIKGLLTTIIPNTAFSQLFPRME